MARGNPSPFFGGKGGKPLREASELPPPDYDFPLEKPTAKELAARLREEREALVLTLKAVPDPVVDLFVDMLPPFRDKKNAHFVFLIPRGQKYRYYCVPFPVVLPMLTWVKLSQEKRPRWQLTLVPSRHKLVGRNGPRVENIALDDYYNTDGR